MSDRLLLFATITSTYNNKPHKLNTPKTETHNRPRSHTSRILKKIFPKIQLNVRLRSPCSSKWPPSIPVLCAFLNRPDATLCPLQTALSSLTAEPQIHVNNKDRSLLYHDPQLFRSTSHHHKKLCLITVPPHQPSF